MSNLSKTSVKCHALRTLACKLLMVSPPFPMTSPALEAGTIISCTVMPGPSLWLNAGAGRPFSTISVKSLLAVLIRERKWHQLFLPIMSRLTRDGIEEKY